MTRKLFIKILLAAAFAQSIFLSSCSTDVDLLEPYKPITIVYGLLNINDNTQYIKINKAFLGEGDALIMAQQSDSINYQPGDLDVYLQKQGDANLITCFDTTGIAKDDGTFSNPYQLLFYTNTVIDASSKYNLIIHRHTDGAVINAETKIVGTVDITIPSSPISQINLFNAASQTYSTQNIKWKPGANAKIYNVVVRFTYYETLINPPGTTDTVRLDYNLGNIVMDDIFSTQEQQLQLQGEQYFNFIGTSISSNSNVNSVTRIENDSLEIIVTAGAEDLYTYILVNEPSIGLIQEKPEYTNINNGVGIFSSRWKRTLKNKMHVNTINELRNGPFTGQYF